MTIGMHNLAAAAEVRALLSRARIAQHSWRDVSVRERLSRLRGMRHTIANNPQPLLEAIRLTRSGRPDAELLASEVLPFLDAIKFLEANAEKLLRPNQPDDVRRPFWLRGVHLEFRREPIGVVLIVAPSNYPLFLPGVQLVQALAAGNAALLKPGAGASPAMLTLREYAASAGISPELVVLLDESPDTAADVIAAGVDKIWLTGSARTGRAVAKLAAETLTPLVSELSGCDAVILLPGADAVLAARAITFGLSLNNSQTCMRPHRVLVHESLEANFRQALQKRLSAIRVPIRRNTITQLQSLVQEALHRGAVQLQGECDGDSVTPFVFADVPANSNLWNADIFAPVLAMNTFKGTDEAVYLHNACDYALTVSVFGPEPEARALAEQLDAGTVLINDLIVPTADPRLPFSGRKQSGYGVTRGAEGLLEFTRVKAVTARRSEYRHLEPPRSSDAQLFSGAISALHGRGSICRLRGAIAAIKAVLRRNEEGSHRHV
jgi:acyl-CoA reductase-like NAD-dependent aldehyde dehydrogenase